MWDKKEKNDVTLKKGVCGKSIMMLGTKRGAVETPMDNLDGSGMRDETTGLISYMILPLAVEVQQVRLDLPNDRTT